MPRRDTLQLEDHFQALKQWRNREGVDRFVCPVDPLHGEMQAHQHRDLVGLKCPKCEFKIKRVPPIVTAAYYRV